MSNDCIQTARDAPCGWCHYPVPPDGASEWHCGQVCQSAFYLFQSRAFEWASWPSEPAELVDLEAFTLELGQAVPTPAVDAASMGHRIERRPDAPPQVLWCPRCDAPHPVALWQTPRGRVVQRCSCCSYPLDDYHIYSTFYDATKDLWVQRAACARLREEWGWTWSCRRGDPSHP